MCIINIERDLLATEPVTNVVRVPVNQSYSDGIVENQLEVCEEIRVNKVACFLKRVVNVVVGVGIVQINADCFLDGGEIEIVFKVCGRCGVFVRVSDTKKCKLNIYGKKTFLLIDTPSTIVVIWRLDVVPALIGGLETCLHSHVCGSVHLFAFRTLIKTTANHVASELHVLVYSVIYGFDTVGIMHRKFGILRCLN